MSWRDWSFKNFVGTVNTTGLSSVVTTLLWFLTGLWTLRAMEWALYPDANVALKRMAALVALLPFHAAWCGYLLARSGVNVVSSQLKRSTNTEYVKAKGKADAAKVAAAGTTSTTTHSSAAALPAAEPDAFRDDERGEEPEHG
jgi:hypothetical protein